MTFASLTLVSRVAGGARDFVVAKVIGASQSMAADAYFTALTFPNLFRRIFAEGAFAAAFVPAYSRKLGAEGEEEADRMATDALAAVAAASVILTILCQLAMPWIMRFYSHGYLADPAKFKLTVILTQVTMPYLPCMVIASLFAGVLNARGRFFISGLYPILLNLIMLALILPQHDPVRAAWAASIGVVIAGVAQAGLVWWAAARAGARIRLVWPRLTTEVVRLLRVAGPAALANSATQINLVISGVLASQVAGMRSWMNYADRLYQLPWSLAGVAIGIALLPRLSQALQAKDHDDVKRAMDQGLVMALSLTLPAAAAMIAMPVFLIDGLFTGRSFLHQDAVNSGILLLHYGWGVPAFVLLRILQPAFFARGDTRTPTVFALVSVAVNAILSVTLFYTIGFYGVAIATSTAAWLNVIQMWITLKRRGLYSADAVVWSRMLRILAASAGLGLILFGAVLLRPQIEAVVHYKEIAIILVCIAGAAIYPALLFASGGLTIAEFKAALRRKPKDPPPIAP